MTKLTLTALALGLAFCLPATSRATITVSFGEHLMLPTDELEVPIFISTDASEEISAVDFYLQIEDGITYTNGPYVTAVEFLNHPTLTDPIFSVVSSSTAPYGDPWDVENGTSTGLKPAFAVFANAPSGVSADVPASGVLAYVTFKTVNAAFGVYSVSYSMDDLGITLMAKTTGTLEPGVDYFLDDGHIHIDPEPSSVLLGLLAAVGAAAVIRRKVLARRAACAALAGL